MIFSAKLPGVGGALAVGRRFDIAGGGAVREADELPSMIEYSLLRFGAAAAA
jgi:hypothetical protein